MVEETITRKIREFVRELKVHGIRVSKAILFGSRASGKAHEYSDIDIAIVSPDFGKDRYKEGVKLFEIAYKIDPRIEPVPVSTDAYKNDTWLPLIYEIRENGVIIKMA